MSRRPESRPLLYTLVGLFSLMVHVPLLLTAALAFPPEEKPLTEDYSVEPIQLVEEPPPEVDDTPKQVVSLDKPEEPTEAPDDAKLLDRYNQKAEREMMRKRPPGVARPTGGRPQRTAQPTPPQPPPKAEAKPEPEPDTKPPVPEIPTPLLKRPTADNDAPGAIERSTTPTEPAAEPADPSEQQPPDAKADNEPPPKLDLNKVIPSMADLMGPAAPSGAPIQDYLDVEEGDKDLLNRKETRYWSFFDRLKRAVRRQWRPNQVYRSHDPRGQIYGVKDRLTIVRVTLLGDGSLKSMYVEKPSGLDFLDNEAVRAFRAAQPFPNPPEGLKDHRGEIKFSFGFMFEIHGRGSRIIRYRR